MNYIVKKEIDSKYLVDFRNELGWKTLSYDLAKRAIEGSMINISVYHNDICVGIGRIVGDKVYKGMLTDILVKKEYQKKGVGKLIVTNLINELRDYIKEGDLFQLEASPTANNREFYINCGLKYKPENQDGVYLWIEK